MSFRNEIRLLGEAFRTAMSDRFFDWLTHHDVFAANIASLGFIWA